MRIYNTYYNIFHRKMEALFYPEFSQDSDAFFSIFSRFLQNTHLFLLESILFHGQQPPPCRRAAKLPRFFGKDITRSIDNNRKLC